VTITDPENPLETTLSSPEQPAAENQEPCLETEIPLGEQPDLGIMENPEIPAEKPAPPPDPLSKEPPFAWLRELLGMLITGLLVFLIINTTTGRYIVLSVSMQPNLHEGEWIIASKITYWLDDPQRGDIVVVQPPPAEGETPFVKRLIGLPGDTIEVSNGLVRVNGSIIHEPYINAPPNYSNQWILGPDDYFVLGDNRTNSSDSHIWGMLSREQILAKAIFRYWPLAKFGPFPHYTYSELENNP